MSTLFGELLRDHRLAADLTQEALAERTGMSDRSIRALERGQNRPQRETARRLAEALRLSGPDLRRFLSLAAPSPRRRTSAGVDRTDAGLLPVPPTTMLGRERELAEVIALLTQPQIRIVTLTGPGGVGKTRLAVEAARTTDGPLSGGAVFVPLASLSDPELVLSAVARSLDLTEEAHGPLLTRLIPALQSRHLLLVLDNFEHLLDAAPRIGALRAACPDLRVLVTSRAPLRLQGEQIYPVRPLDVPASRESGQMGLSALDALRQVPAVRLFAERAQAVKPDFALTPSNGWAVAEICRQLDGLPLAIELAAARTALLSPEALLVQLAHPLRLLTGGARDLPERQRTMRRAIAWSHDLLDRDEQVLFRRLSVFAGGFDLKAVEAVCLHGLAIDALEGISVLTEASLLVADEAEEPRFRMLETIRELARERAEAAGEDSEIRTRHAMYYLDLAEELSRLMVGSRQAEHVRRVDRELDNIRAALTWSRDSGDLRTTLRLAATLFDYWYMRGLRSEGRTWLEGALALTAPDHTRERAAALTASGGLAGLQGDFEEARQRVEEAVDIWRELGDSTGLQDVLSHLALTYEGLGEGEKSWAALEEGLAVARSAGNWVHIGKALNGLGVQSARYRRDFETAHVLFEEAVIAFRAAGSAGGMAMVTNSLGDMARLRGKFVEARAHYERSLDLAREAVSQSHQASAFHNLGHTLHCLGDDDAAREHFLESLVLFRNMGDTRGVAECVAGLACLEAQSDPARTVRWFRAARAAVVDMGAALSESNEAQYESALAMARAELGEETFATALGTPPSSLDTAVREVLAAD